MTSNATRLDNKFDWSMTLGKLLDNIPRPVISHILHEYTVKRYWASIVSKKLKNELV